MLQAQLLICKNFLSSYIFLSDAVQFITDLIMFSHYKTWIWFYYVLIIVHFREVSCKPV
uniref:Uncharacterized protein n=1 Tax=Arundo donax TaxID=35708 RepID=A0A0A9ELU6_ARUDO